MKQFKNIAENLTSNFTENDKHNLINTYNEFQQTSDLSVLFKSAEPLFQKAGDMLQQSGMLNMLNTNNDQQLKIEDSTENNPDEQE